jgi:hypothetical protein
VLRLVRPGDVDAEVLGLLLGELGELDPERVEVQRATFSSRCLGSVSTLGAPSSVKYSSVL